MHVLRQVALLLALLVFGTQAMAGQEGRFRPRDARVPVFFEIRFEEAGFAPLTIIDNDVNDSDPAIGAINYSGPYGDLVVNVTTGISTSTISDGTTKAQLQLNSVLVGGPAGSKLLITLVDRSFRYPSGSSLVLQSAVSGISPTGGSGIFNSWANTNEASPLASYPTEIPLTSIGAPQLGSLGSGPFSANSSTAFGPATDYSLFSQASIVLPPSGATNFDLITSVDSNSAAPTAAGTFDAVNDFSIGSNPAGAWSYGYSMILGGPFVLHNTGTVNYFPGVDRWSSPAVDPAIGIMHNRTGSTVQGNPPTYAIPPDMLHMHPGQGTGPGGIYDIVRWTAPFAGSYTVQGEFAGLDTVTSVADTDVHILINSTNDIFDSVLNGVGTQASFSRNINVNAGDTVDFLVGDGPSGHFQNDSTGLKVTLTPTGTINVTTNLNASTFSLTGPASYSGSGTSFSQPNAPAGTYTIVFAPASSNVITPPSLTATLTSGGSLNFFGAYAQAATPQTRQGGPSQTNSVAFTSEPVNTATGNYYFQRTDFAVPGRGLPMVFTRTYNSAGISTGPLGLGWTHSYEIVLQPDTSTGLVTISWGDGHQELYSPAGGGAYTPLTAGCFSQLAQKSDNSFELTLKNRPKYEFSPLGRLSQVIDRNANPITLSYDSSGNLILITDTVGRQFSLVYSGSLLTELHDPTGRVVHYAYDTSSRLQSVTNPAGGVMTFSYDNGGRLVNIVDERGLSIVRNTYDGNGRVVSQLNGRNFRTSFAYSSPAASDTTVTDPLGNQTIYSYDSQLRLIQATDVLGGTVQYTYDSQNDRLQAIDQNANVSNFAYDRNGNLTAATDATGSQTLFVYDSQNDLTQITDPLGHLTSFAFDARGNLTQATDTAGGNTTLLYDNLGQLQQTTNPRSFSTTFSYDSSGNLTQVTDALSGKTQFTYDSVGRQLTVKNSLGQTSSRVYDAIDRVVSITDPLAHSTSFVYDPAGNLLTVTDANGKATQYAYDQTDKLVQVTDAANGVTGYAYDANSQLVGITDANGHITTLTLDGLSRLQKRTDAVGKSRTYTYDLAGNIIAALDGNGKTNSFSYDQLKRLVSAALSDGKNVSYAFDAAGNRITMTDWRGNTTYTYDVLNRAVSVNTPDGQSVGYAYDSVGNRTALTYPDGKVAAYSYDSLNRLTKVTDSAGKATNYTYDPAGNLTSFAHPNGAVSTYSYDGASRLLSVLNAVNGKTNSGFTYGLDNVGNRLQMTLNTGSVQKFAYDSLYRLVSWTAASGQTTQYTYDTVGNRTSVIASTGAVTPYTYDAADELLSVGPATYSYDGNGNQKTKTVNGLMTTYGWDALDRLISVVGGSVNTQHRYDGNGNRVQQQVGSNVYTYVNDTVTPLPVVLNENGVDGNIDYLYGLSMISATANAFQQYYQFDGVGSVINITDQTGALKSNYAYDPWGQFVNPLDPLGGRSKYKFTSEALDTSTGLLYLRARFYDSTVGRFFGRDRMSGAMRMPKSRNGYGYALLNPVRISDPSGLSSVEAPRGQVLGAFTLAPNTDLPNTNAGDIVRYEVNLFGKAIIPGGVFLSIEEITVNGALANEQAIDAQLQDIANYSEELEDGHTTLSEVIGELRNDTSYLLGLNTERLRFLLLRAANAKHIHLNRSQWQ
jgi:RHS repeat-associated protein